MFEIISLIALGLLILRFLRILRTQVSRILIPLLLGISSFLAISCGVLLLSWSYNLVSRVVNVKYQKLVLYDALFNPFHSNVLFLYPLKTSENLWFSFINIVRSGMMFWHVSIFGNLRGNTWCDSTIPHDLLYWNHTLWLRRSPQVLAVVYFINFCSTGCFCFVFHKVFLSPSQFFLHK